MMRIAPVESAEDFARLRELIAEYTAWDFARTRELGFDAATLFDYHYAHEDTSISFFLAIDGDDDVAGCGGFRRLDERVCEMKRLYVRPAFRGRRAGEEIASAIIAAARAAGYEVMRLETTTFMTSAIRLYESLGFRLREPYAEIPPALAPLTVFMEKELR